MAKKKLPAKLMKEAARQLASKGGKARAKRLTREQRAEIGRRGALARWRKKRKKAGPS